MRLAWPHGGSDREDMHKPHPHWREVDSGSIYIGLTDSHMITRLPWGCSRHREEWMRESVCSGGVFIGGQALRLAFWPADRATYNSQLD